MNSIKFDGKLVLDIEKTLGIEFKDKEKVYTIFLHQTYLNESKNTKVIKEKSYLETLGGSLFNLIKVEYIFKYVSTDSYIINFIEKGTRGYIIEDNIELNLNLAKCFKKKIKEDSESNIKRKSRSVLYQIIALVYLENGYEFIKDLIINDIEDGVKCFVKNPVQDWKKIVHKWSGRNRKSIVDYYDVNEYGTYKDKIFEVELKLDDNASIGLGRTKKLAKIDAAYNYCQTYIPKKELNKNIINLEFKNYKINKPKLSLDRIKKLGEIETIKISDIWLFNQCFIHNSYIIEKESSFYESYDELSFLGIYVKDVALETFIYKYRAELEKSFGNLENRIKLGVLNKDFDINIFNKMKLDKYMLIGNDKINKTGITDNVSKNVIKAIFGAMFLSNGNLSNSFIDIYEEYIQEYIEKISFSEFKDIKNSDIEIQLEQLGKSISETPTPDLNEQLDEYKLDIINLYNNKSLENKQVNFQYNGKPKEKQSVVVYQRHKNYTRDRQTSINALAYANYLCEIDNHHHTFIRKNSNNNYTEPHHLIPMAYYNQFNISLDVEENIVSLCSNCHNQIHYGKGSEELLQILYKQRKDDLERVGIHITLKELYEMY